MKKFIMFMMLLFATLTINAQPYALQSRRTFFDNTYVTVQGGAFMPMDMNSVLPLNGEAGVKLGKWFSPVFGLNIESDAFFGSNHWNGDKNIVRGLNTGLNGTIDFRNLFGHFNANRKFTVIGEAGFGWLVKFGEGLAGSNTNYLTAKTGVAAVWKLNHGWDLFAEPVVFWNLNRDYTHSHNIQFCKTAAQLGLQLGVTYNFKTSNGTHNFKEYNIGEYDATIARLNDELAKKPQVVEVPVEKVTEKIVEVPSYVNNTTVITFAQGSYELTTSAKNQLDELAKTVKAVKVISGSASPEGDKTFNDQLSLKRAQVVAMYLAERQVYADAVEGLGATGDDSQRIVTITIK